MKWCIVELKKMASPSVPSVSRVETSSESSSDSTSTTTSTVSEHSKTSNIINRYSCSVERGLYWVPYGFRWFDLDSTRFTRPVAATHCHSVCDRRDLSPTPVPGTCSNFKGRFKQ